MALKFWRGPLGDLLNPKVRWAALPHQSSRGWSLTQLVVDVHGSPQVFFDMEIGGEPAGMS